jgi:hypothetical protein
MTSPWEISFVHDGSLFALPAKGFETVAACEIGGVGERAKVLAVRALGLDGHAVLILALRGVDLHGLEQVLLGIRHDHSRSHTGVTVEATGRHMGAVDPAIVAGEEEVHVRAVADDDLVDGLIELERSDWMVDNPFVRSIRNTSCTRRRWCLIGRRRFFGRTMKRVGVTVFILILFWAAEAIWDQLEKRLKFIEPLSYMPPLLEVVDEVLAVVGDVSEALDLDRASTLSSFHL